MRRWTGWALRAAARRWPSGVRAEMLREWQAEIAYLETEPGTAWLRLRFVLSLLASPPVRDPDGVPRGWREAAPGLGAAGALMLSGVAGMAVQRLATLFEPALRPLLGLGPEAVLDGWRGYLVPTGALALWGLLTGWLTGRRLPFGRDGRLGTWGPAVLAPVALIPAFLLLAAPALAPGLDLGAAPWLSPATIGVAALTVPVWTAVIAVLGRWGWAGVALGVAGAPAGALLAVMTGALTLGVWPARVWSAALGNDQWSDVSFLGHWVWVLTAYGWMALIHTASGRTARPRPEARRTSGTAAVLPRAALAAGAACLVLAVVAWAYVVTVLSPAMDDMSAVAPMPGGDGEIYLWVAELRWGAVLLAALGLLVARADRRGGGLSALLLAAGLLAGEAVLLRAGLTGVAWSRVALLVAAALIAGSWLIGRGPVTAATARRRVTTAAVGGAICGPLLFLQGTPAENHPFMPAGLPVTTAGLAVGGALLAAVLAVAYRRPHPVAGAVLVAAPVAVLLWYGRYLSNGVDASLSQPGVLAGGPLAVVAGLLIVRPAWSRGGKGAALGTGAALAGVPVTVLLALAGMGSSLLSSALFVLDGTSYPADGLSFLPGVATLVLPAAALLAQHGDPGRPIPQPGGPDTDGSGTVVPEEPPCSRPPVVPYG
ncbi:hypothetical protein [Actinoplanes siamensis]|uniref:Uncharacterized protein n=1 Tax=Actinoplanes siamensis TaxID=1223317 RepID=A0A919N465_9ACTN|nr:hypothetical protein [Actinoplanes siamensis]GIF04036.1 hypothetical protein Asi03nite_15740 [Actinoplanes siamensis]